ncbi:S-adenosyl-L-methionine-dependent methyltransferase [Plectosphaerella plurivora]|uniref:S-adenosyl-L-methionine-dependent methyltransferase n=1 Tax=Plectosphaerella plurivora TaxID=936078 RepID=A0A9P8VG01_9PEZI|nr:S-adenosyl-L-methionine-dependent methyltransferase [Plectosphaerella plurivora]
MASTLSQDTVQSGSNPKLEAFYSDSQTIFWFDGVLGGARHFGYYEPGTKSPFPIKKSLLRMEEELFKALRLPTGSRLLDAGCGAGHVSAYMASKGMIVTAIDVIPRHIELSKKTQARLAAVDAPGSIERVLQLDYHHLEELGLGQNLLDGVYTIEALVHAEDAATVLAGFYASLRPGGRVVLHEYEQDVVDETELAAMAVVNEGFSMPMHDVSRPGALKTLLEGAGFRDVEVRDLSENVRPMTRMNYAISVLPYSLLSPQRLARHSVSAVAGVQLHRNLRQGRWKYLQVSATKPEFGEGVGGSV